MQFSPSLRTFLSFLLVLFLARNPLVRIAISAPQNSNSGQGDVNRADPCAHLPNPPGNANGIDQQCPAIGSSSGVSKGDFNGDGVADLAIGVPGAQEWVADLPNDANKKFVADYKAKFKMAPSFYGAQTYDAAYLIDSGLKAVNNDMSKKDELRKAMEKADFKSVRGNFKFGNNHIPIQNFYLQDAVKNADGSYSLKTVATIVENDQDKFHDKCMMK